jgi:hypothetical protein
VLSLLDATAAGDADTPAGDAVAAEELPLPYSRNATTAAVTEDTQGRALHDPEGHL